MSAAHTAIAASLERLYLCARYSCWAVQSAPPAAARGQLVQAASVLPALVPESPPPEHPRHADEEKGTEGVGASAVSGGAAADAATAASPPGGDGALPFVDPNEEDAEASVQRAVSGTSSSLELIAGNGECSAGGSLPAKEKKARAGLLAWLFCCGCGAGAGLCGLFRKHEPKARTVILNASEQPPEAAREYASNRVVSSKYTLISFIPLNLWQQYHRVSNVYFTLVAALSWWREVSPFDPGGSTVAIIFIVVVGMLKDAADDYKRHVEDNALNQLSFTTRLRRAESAPDGAPVGADGGIAGASTTPSSASSGVGAEANGGAAGASEEIAGVVQERVAWQDLKVGDTVLVRDNEQFPADMVCLHTSLEGDVCFVKTANLDGETNLKLRSVAPGVSTDSVAHALMLEGEVTAEAPSPNLTSMEGTIRIEGSEKVALSINEVLLRGTTLKNTGSVVGCVVYTGHESRIVMNASAPPYKRSTYDAFINWQILYIFVVQICLILGSAGGSLAFRQENRESAWYLDFVNDSDGDFLFFFKKCITFFILYSYMVPISLVVTMEIVKALQSSVMIDRDPLMYDAETDERARARTTSLNEDLGAVRYVFSDKTGTLTANDMNLRQLCVGGKNYGRMGFKLEDFIGAGAPADGADSGEPEDVVSAAENGNGNERYGAAGAPRARRPSDIARTVPRGREAAVAARRAFDPALDVSSPDAAGALTCLALCQTILVTRDEDTGGVSYQGSSPDEVALVCAAARLGFAYVDRSATALTMCVDGGKNVTYETEVVLEFSSERRRMAVLVKENDTADSHVTLYIKGADSAIMPRLRAPRNMREREVLAETERLLEEYSLEGLRTLVLARREIPLADFREWEARYASASQLTEGRHEAMEALAEEVEQHLELLGATAIEDRLQDRVPETLGKLRDAGVHVWVITGDKQQTAINIARSAGLFTGDPRDILKLNARSDEELAEVMRDVEMSVFKSSEGSAASQPNGARARRRALTARDYLLPWRWFRSRKEAPGAQTLEPPSARNMRVFASPDSIYKHQAEMASAQLVVDGGTLDLILDDVTLEARLASLAQRCTAVVVCRASPIQKARVVRMMKGKSKAVTLSIGDGANDVPMIQEAHIGVGIFGKEGRQSVNNSDYAIGQFRFLQDLMLVHGQQDRQRLARLIKYSFFKNLAFAFMMFFTQIYVGWSGQSPANATPAALFNVVFTALPIGVLAVMDFGLRRSTLLRFPQLYLSHRSLTRGVFWKSLLEGVGFGAVAFFVPFWLFSFDAGRNNINDFESCGNLAYTIVLTIVTLDLCLVVRSWSVLFTFTIFACYFVWYPFYNVYPSLYTETKGFTAEGSAAHSFADVRWWLAVALSAMFTTTYRLCWLTQRVLFRPRDEDIVREWELLQSKINWQREREERVKARGGGGSTTSSARSPDSPQESWAGGAREEQGNGGLRMGGSIQMAHVSSDRAY